MCGYFNLLEVILTGSRLKRVPTYLIKTSRSVCNAPSYKKCNKKSTCSSQNGPGLERRHFDAWGNLAKLQQNGVAIVLPTDGTATKLLLLDRGYTSHEHLSEVGLIHMNGRLYDPVLRSFLMPDNFIQQPENTQNYNRYAYVLNNPLMYTDPSGELFFTTAILIGALVAAATYTMTALLADVPFSVGGLLKATFIGAASAAVTFGIGTGAEKLFTTFISKAAFQAVAHGTFQGGMTAISGGKFWSGFAAGALSSIASSVWGGGSNSQWQGIGGKIADSGAGMIAFGTVVGGAGASLTGGNFWQGAVTGLVVSGLNHYLHQMKAKNNIDRKLIAKGLNPTDPSTIKNNDELKSFTKEMFSNSLDKTGDLAVYLVDRISDLSGKSAYGETVPTSDQKHVQRINISKSALSSWRLAASTVGHELNHAYHFISGAYNRWSKISADYAFAKSEYISQAWEYMNGGVPTNSIMMDNFNTMISEEYAVGRKK
jgi:RHS repeat-associated protein